VYTIIGYTLELLSIQLWTLEVAHMIEVCVTTNSHNVNSMFVVNG